MTPEERETVIQFDDAGPRARVYTCWKALAQKLKKLGFAPTRTDRNGGRVIAWHFEVPKTYILLRRPRRVTLTETQRRKLVERLQRARAAVRTKVAV